MSGGPEDGNRWSSKGDLKVVLVKRGRHYLYGLIDGEYVFLRFLEAPDEDDD